MANITFAAGTTSAFTPGTDVLQFTDTTSAASLLLQQVGADLLITDSVAGGSMTLSATTISQLTSTNVTFADNSQIFAGGANADTLSGAAVAGTNSQFIGLGGDDTIAISGGDNVAYGNLGNDSITGGTGADSLYAGQGDDHVTTGSGGHNAVYGNQGADSVTVGGGGDTVYGGAGNDSITASAHNGNNYLNGNQGNDTIVGGSGNDTIIGGDAASTLTIGAGNSSVQAFAGNDIISVTGGTGSSTILAGDGSDTITNAGGTQIIYGNQGDDVINNAAGHASTIYGGLNNDTITASTITGAVGDVIYGNAGNDSIIAGVGADTIYGDDNGSAGADTIVATLGGAAMIYAGGNGGAVAGDLVKVNLATMLTSTIYGGGAAYATEVDTLYIADGNANITTGNLTADNFAHMYGFEKLTFTNDANTKNIVLTNAIGARASDGGLIVDFSTTTTNTGTQSGGVTVDGSALTTNLTVTGGTSTNTFVDGTGNDSLLGGGVVDTFNDTIVGGGHNTIVGGAGADIINITAANLTANDAIYGGSINLVGGAADVLNVVDSTGPVTLTAVAGATTGELSGVHGVEHLTVLGNSYLKTITLSDAYVGGANGAATTTAIIDVGGLAGAGTGQTGNVVFTSNTTVATYDVVVDLHSATGNATFVGGGGADSFVGSGGTNLFQSTAANWALGADTINGTTSANSTLTFTSSGVIDLAHGTVTNVGTINLANSTGNVFTGNTNATTVTINGGSTADNITAGVGLETINGGAGNDTIIGASTGTGGASNELLYGNAGNDTFSFTAAANLNSHVTIWGGDATGDTGETNTLSVSGAAYTLTTGGNIANISGIEQIYIGGGAFNQSITALSDAFVSSSALTISGGHKEIISVTGGANSQLGTVSIDGSSVTAVNALLIDASATSSAYGETIRGGLGANTIIAGAGADSINTATGSIIGSSLVGGAGNDTITFAAAADFIAADTIWGGTSTTDTGNTYTGGAGGDEMLFSVTMTNNINSTTLASKAGIEMLVFSGNTNTIVTLNDTFVATSAAHVTDFNTNTAEAASLSGSHAVELNFGGTTGNSVDASTLTGGTNAVVINSSANVSLLSVGANTVFLSDAHGYVTSGTTSSSIYGGSGNDTIIGNNSATAGSYFALGAGTNKVVVGSDVYSDTVDAGSAGTNTIEVAGPHDSTHFITINNWGAGTNTLKLITSGDTSSVGTVASLFTAGNTSLLAAANTGGAVTAVTGVTAGQYTEITSSGADAATTGDNYVVYHGFGFGGGAASTNTEATFTTFINTVGTHIVLGTGASAAGSAFIAVWDNGTDTHVDLIKFGTALNTNSATVTEIASLIGVADARTVETHLSFL